MTARTAVSAPSTWPGTRRPGAAAPGTQQRVGAELGVDRRRVAVGVEQAAYALAGRGGVAQVVQPELGDDEAGAAAGREVGEVQPDGARTVRQVEGAGVAAGHGDLDARDDVEGEEVEEPSAGEGLERPVVSSPRRAAR